MIACHRQEKNKAAFPKNNSVQSLGLRPSGVGMARRFYCEAILLHKQPKKWQKLMRNAMACDFSWQASVKEYEKLYAAL
jgi:glycogen synthase